MCSNYNHHCSIDLIPTTYIVVVLLLLSILKFKNIDGLCMIDGHFHSIHPKVPLALLSLRTQICKHALRLIKKDTQHNISQRY
jgi:hypothetical protein